MEVEVIGHFRLLLCTGFYLDLKDTFVVPLFRRNLISVSYLDKSGYSYSFNNFMSNFYLKIRNIFETIRISLKITYLRPFYICIWGKFI